MAEHNNIGVFQLPNGNWAYRFTQTVNGKRHNHKSVKDENGKPMKSQKAAIRARQLAIMAAEAKKNQKPQRRVTFAEVYQEYSEKGRSGKAYATIRKQDSLWNNHLAKQFGERFIDGISAAEVNDYLSMLYYTEGRAYRYVEGFLKMFYLIFGQAYSRNYLDVDTYNKLCVNKDVRICMPKMKIDEDTDIVAFDCEQIELLDNYFHSTNAETAYLLGRYCGLRINECYGLKWENVDTERGTITIDRQMQYQEGLIKLVSLKTRNARRTVYMSDKLKVYLQELEQNNRKYTAAQLIMTGLLYIGWILNIGFICMIVCLMIRARKFDVTLIGLCLWLFGFLVSVTLMDVARFKFIFVGIIGCIVEIVVAIWFIVRTYIEGKEHKAEQIMKKALLEKELKQYATFSKGVLKLTKCSPQFSNALQISKVMYTPMSYNPVRYIYTSATVGGITTGGVDKVGGNYVRSGREVDSGKNKLLYWGQKVKQIQLTDELYKKAQKSIIKNYLNDNKQIVVEGEAGGGLEAAAQIFGTYSLEVQMILYAGYPSDLKCREIIDWICEVE